MFSRFLPFALFGFMVVPSTSMGQAPANLLRNGSFQDDWLTLLPKNKNHHWVYFPDFYNRRDFNPDFWTLKGSWEWSGADKPMGERRLILRGPEASLSQQVNWVAVHDDRVPGGGSPDMGGFPGLVPQRSPQPERLVGDLTFRVRLKGQNVPAGAGSLQLSLPPATVRTPVPAGTYAGQWVEVKLPANDWLTAAQQAAAKNPKETEESRKAGLLLPQFAEVRIDYKAAAGEVVLEQAELLETRKLGANLVRNPSFEETDAAGYPLHWSRPQKYRYFPPGHYYIFNTWHNSSYPNRGPVAADSLIAHGGQRSLKMIIASGDEKCVVSEPITLKQKLPHLIEVQAWVRHDKLAMLQIDAEDEKGQRLDCFDFIQKVPFSIGTDDWRLLRQVFRPRQPVASIRLKLCARGVNGYTLEDTTTQPQNNVTGTIWWDDIHVSEPESTEAELLDRGVKPAAPAALPAPVQPMIESLDLGERRIGANTLRAVLVNPGAEGTFDISWGYDYPEGKKGKGSGEILKIPARGRVTVELPYTIEEPCPTAYTEYRGTLSLRRTEGKTEQSTELWFGVWTTPIRIDLGALYLRPEQKQLVRLNLGLSTPAVESLTAVRLELIDRRTEKALRTVMIAQPLAKIREQRGKIPKGLRDDFDNLLLTDLDVSDLPMQPFNDPQRHYYVSVSALGPQGRLVAWAGSALFCRQDADPPQPAIERVRIEKNLLYINDRPWMPWGGVYGYVPDYAGPADPGGAEYRDLRNLPVRSIYDQYQSDIYTRKRDDFNCNRYVASTITPQQTIETRWKDNLYCSTAFVTPAPDPVPPFSLDDLSKKAGGQDKLDKYLTFCKTAPMVVSVTPGLEESFGLFLKMTPEQLQGLGEVVADLRKRTGKPVMVGHGGYYNRFDFEKVPYFDIYDPETEPIYPANLHTALAPLVQGKDKVIWLRPQMYEDVPYERWRFHVYVELMRGCRGWQIAHGPGDASLFRGLHGEMEFFKPIVYSRDPGPRITIEPKLEHWSRQHQGKTYLIAATTRGIQLGRWRWSDEGLHRLTPEARQAGRGRISAATEPASGPSIHGLQHLPDARTWPAGSKLTQWVRLNAKDRPSNVVLLVKADGRWTHAASWGKFDPASFGTDRKQTAWFLHSLYNDANGFLGWNDKLLENALPYVLTRSVEMGALPAAGEWSSLEVPLEKIGAAGKPIDGVAFLHEGGQVEWGRTALADPEGGESIVWGDFVGQPPEQLARTSIRVAGLKAGTKVRVLFEDRELTAGDGHFVDDFRGQDLYQRLGGLGYGSEPVALHLYEIP